MYTSDNNPFNLLAKLLALTLKKKPVEVQPLESKEDKRCFDKAIAVLEPYQDEMSEAATIGVTSQTSDAIIEQCKKFPFDVLYKILLVLDNYFTWEQISEEFDEEVRFQALNTNIEETGLRILPNIPSPRTEFEGRVRQTADSFSESLNSDFRNCYYIEEKNLQINGIQYELENVIYQVEHRNRNREQLLVAYSPLTSLQMEDVLKINCFSREDEHGLAHNFFSIDELKEEKLCVEAYKNLYHRACAMDADIVMGPEMLCPQSLYEVDDFGYNTYLHQWSKEKRKLHERAPALILTPSFWKDGRNTVRAFDRRGKLLLEQDKQCPFTYSKKITDTGKEKYQENLENRIYRVVILHIPYWGRIAFPICKDFLTPAYQDLLIRVLHATLILCPSYSVGSANFELALSAGVQFQATTLWGNSCSALYPCENTGYTGAIRLPNIGHEALTVRFELECEGKCSEKCAFLIQVPLNCAGESRRQDIGAKCTHLLNDL